LYIQRELRYDHVVLQQQMHIVPKWKHLVKWSQQMLTVLRRQPELLQLQLLGLHIVF